MRVLFVTFIEPSKYSGGGLVSYQSLLELTNSAEVDYLGPEFDVEKFSDLKIKKLYFYGRDESLLRRAMFSLAGLPSLYYYSYKSNEKSIDVNSYDLVYCEDSRSDFVIKWAKKSNVPTFVRVQNIEQDYLYKRMKNDKSIREKISAFLKYISIQRRENYCFKYTNKAIFLTLNDKERGIELYSKADLLDKSFILPVCIAPRLCNEIPSSNLKKGYILLTGSFWYGVNANGAVWFIDNVWKQLSNLTDVNLVIAGARPNDDIRNRTNKDERIILIDTPEDMSPYFNDAKVYAAPIFDGAGMKVKVAEALSWGLPVVATSHALIGYDSVKDVCVLANDSEQFVKGIMSILNSEYSKNSIKDVFTTFYSTDSSTKIMRNLLSEIEKD